MGTIFTPQLYTITEVRGHDEPRDEWFVMAAPLSVISSYFMMHPVAGQRIIQECAPDGGVCTLYIPSARSTLQNSIGLFLARRYTPQQLTLDETAFEHNPTAGEDAVDVFLRANPLSNNMLPPGTYTVVTTQTDPKTGHVIGTVYDEEKNEHKIDLGKHDGYAKHYGYAPFEAEHSGDK